MNGLWSSTYRAAFTKKNKKNKNKRRDVAERGKIRMVINQEEEREEEKKQRKEKWRKLKRHNGNKN